eukprot:s3717_g2.t1
MNMRSNLDGGMAGKKLVKKRGYANEVHDEYEDKGQTEEAYYHGEDADVAEAYELGPYAGASGVVWSRPGEGEEQIPMCSMRPHWQLSICPKTGYGVGPKKGKGRGKSGSKGKKKSKGGAYAAAPSNVMLFSLKDPDDGFQDEEGVWAPDGPWGQTTSQGRFVEIQKVIKPTMLAKVEVRDQLLCRDPSRSAQEEAHQFVKLVEEEPSVYGFTAGSAPATAAPLRFRAEPGGSRPWSQRGYRGEAEMPWAPPMPKSGSATVGSASAVLGASAKAPGPAQFWRRIWRSASFCMACVAVIAMPRWLQGTLKETAGFSSRVLSGPTRDAASLVYCKMAWAGTREALLAAWRAIEKQRWPEAVGAFCAYLTGRGEQSKRA